jgi:hypothetical protein
MGAQWSLVKRFFGVRVPAAYAATPPPALDALALEEDLRLMHTRLRGLQNQIEAARAEAKALQAKGLVRAAGAYAKRAGILIQMHATRAEQLMAFENMITLLGQSEVNAAHVRSLERMLDHVKRAAPVLADGRAVTPAVMQQLVDQWEREADQLEEQTEALVEAGSAGSEPMSEREALAALAALDAPPQAAAPRVDRPDAPQDVVIPLDDHDPPQAESAWRTAKYEDPTVSSFAALRAKVAGDADELAPLPDAPRTRVTLAARVANAAKRESVPIV